MVLGNRAAQHGSGWQLRAEAFDRGADGRVGGLLLGDRGHERVAVARLDGQQRGDSRVAPGNPHSLGGLRRGGDDLHRPGRSGSHRGLYPLIADSRGVRAGHDLNRWHRELQLGDRDRQRDEYGERERAVCERPSPESLAPGREPG